MQDFELILKGVIESPKGILIVQRSKNDKWLPEIWEFPGGKFEQGSLIKNLRREITEETGLTGVAFGNMNVIKKTVKQIGPGEYKYEAGQCIVKFYIYGTKKKNYEIKLSDLSDEHQDFKWVAKESDIEGLELDPITKEILQRIFNKN